MTVVDVISVAVYKLATLRQGDRDRFKRTTPRLAAGYCLLFSPVIPCSTKPAPYLIRGNPVGPSGYRLEFTPVKTGAGMTNSRQAAGYQPSNENGQGGRLALPGSPLLPFYCTVKLVAALPESPFSVATAPA
jgi:hypothetical protein